jgi:3-hydroxyisobutyrate dehydrogenase-like beta-hydroxyacid dehydrogenase
MDLDDVGLVSTAEDLPPLGAAMRLLAGLEAQRNLIDTQGDTRRAGEVPAGSITQALRNLAAIRQQRLTAEAQRFQQRYGIKLHLAV